MEQPVVVVKNQNNRYNFKYIENKWQKNWEENKTFSVKADKNKKTGGKDYGRCVGEG